MSESQNVEIGFNKLYYENVQTSERFFSLQDAINSVEITEETATTEETETIGGTETTEETQGTQEAQGTETQGTETTQETQETEATGVQIKVINDSEEKTKTTLDENKKVILDLNGKTIAFNLGETDDVCITNNGDLTIKGEGSIESTAASAIENKGRLTIGEDDEDIKTDQPQIKGKTFGVKVGEGATFNFFDGNITSETDGAIDGKISSTPKNYAKRIRKNEDGTETIDLDDDWNLKFLLDTSGKTRDINVENNTTVMANSSEGEIGEKVYGSENEGDKLNDEKDEMKLDEENSDNLTMANIDADGNIDEDGKVTLNGVTYEVEKEEVKEYNSPFTEDELQTKPKTDKVGYEFDGWYSDEGYKNKIEEGNNFTTENADFQNDKIADTDAYIFAKWNANKYTVELDLAGGEYDGKPTVDNITATYDEVLNILNPTRKGYTFQGWSSTGFRGLGNNALTGESADNMSAWGGEQTKNTYFKNLTNKNNGTVKLEATWGGGATFDTGPNVNSKINNLAGQKSKIKSISYSDKIEEQYKTGDHKVSSKDSTLPIYMWFGENETIYWWSEGENAYLNENSKDMFNGCSGLTSIDLTNFDTSKVTDMSFMFKNCSSLTSIDLKNFDTSNVTTMSCMFYSCSKLTSIDLTNFASKVTDMTNMFANCSQLTSIDLTKFNTSNVTTMNSMFVRCRSLTSIDLTKFDTSKVTDMSYMFEDCSQSTIIDLTNFNTSNVTTMEKMFKNCSNLTKIYVGDKWSTDKVQIWKSGEMFYGCIKLVGGKETKYDSKKINKEYARLDEPPDKPGYFSLKPVANFFGYNMINIKQQEGYISKMIKYKENNNTEGSVENDAEKGNNTQLNSVDQETQTTEVKIPQIAQINETTFPTISKAIDLANSGDTIKILENINILEDVTIPENKNIKINLNGKKITSNMTSTINNLGNLTIIGTGIIKNETTNGTVIFNTGELTVENSVLTTAQNGGKCIYNNGGNVALKGGKVVTQGMGAIGIYNTGNSSKSTNGSKSIAKNQSVLQNTIIEATGAGSKCVYNECRLEIKKGNIVVSADDSIGIYNGENAQELSISENTEILIKAEEIENYELIKNTDEFKQELEKMKPSYGIYNDSKNNITVEKANMKVERLKSIGIVNKNEGSIILGKADEKYDSASPIIYAISDNTNAIENSEKGKIEFYDGRLVTLTSIKEILTTDKGKYEIAEEIGKNIVNTMLKLIEFTDIKGQIKAE